MKNVLIVTQHFPPINNIAARRFGLMSADFEKFGWRPYVLTTISDGSLSVPIPEDHCIRLVQHPHNNVKIGNNKAKLSRKKRAGFISTIIPVNYRLRSFDNTALNWYLPIRGKLDQILRNYPKPDLVIGSFSPSASLLLARKIAVITNTPWIADYRDLGALRNLMSSQTLKWLDIQIEKYILSSASGITTVSDTFNRIFTTNYQISVKTIFNGFYKNEILSSSGKKKSANQLHLSNHEGIYLHYAGRIYDHQLSAIKILFETIIDYPDIHLVFRSLGPEYLDKELIDLARNFKIDKKFSLLPPTEPDVIKIEQQGAFANLVFEELNEKSFWGAGTLTGKFLKLLPFSKPVLSICRSDNEMAKILEITEKGAVCSTAMDIKQFLNSVILNQNKYKGNTQQIREYSTYSQTQKLCSFMDEISEKRYNR